MATAKPVEVVFSFDTTGSMYPCLTQVRRKIKDTVKRLFKDLPDLRVGIIAHGDYCDKGNPYVTKHLDLSDKPEAIAKFVETVKATGGGDAAECYELVLHEAQDLSWSKKAIKVMVMIGDEVPHGPTDNPGKLDWRKELQKLAALDIPVYGVQCLDSGGGARKFYEELARKSNGYHISLDQFGNVTDLVFAVCFKQDSDKHVEEYEKEVIEGARMTRGLNKMFDVLLGRKGTKKYKARSLHAVAPGRFQVLDVDRDETIRDFVEENELTFETGRGFYEFTKVETIQDYKEIILMDRDTGDMFEGAKARALLGLPEDETAKIKPTDLEDYVVFVQSTSYNRKLIGGTRFLYEVEGWERKAARAGASPATKKKPGKSKKAAPKKASKKKVKG